MAILEKIKGILKTWQQVPLFFWFSVIFLNMLLLLPSIVADPGTSQILPVPPFNSPRGWYDIIFFFFRRENQDIFRVSVDYYIILTFLYLQVRLNWFKILRRIVLFAYLFLLLYSVYDASMFLIFGEHPILYNDILLLLGAFYLIIDLSYTKMFLSILGLILLISSILLIIPFLFNTISIGLSRYRSSRKLMIAGILVWVFIAAMTFWFRFQDYRSITRWITPKIIANFKESLEVREFLQTIEGHPIDSTYYTYDKIKLEQHPNLYLIMIESYGKILIDSDIMKKKYFFYLGELEDTLKQAGWNATSNFSLSPIFGGRSWLSVGSVINGIKIKDQAIYSYLINRVDKYPHLVRFLKQQGYHTFALQPLNRPRPGYSLGNYEQYYQYDTYINFNDLDFNGPAFGFRHIPDQYTLNYAYAKYIKNTSGPIFTFFITISSHSPWIDLPPYPKDWRNLKNLSETHIEKRYTTTSDKIKETISSHYEAGIGPIDYAHHIFYELDVIRDFILNEAEENSIFILLGDHQPPLVTKNNRNFYTPIHIISPDSLFIQNFKHYGFEGGFRFPADSTQFVNHEGLYSLLVRMLTQRYSHTYEDSLPVYRPKGISLSIIR